MRRSILRENAALAAVSGPSGSVSLLVPIYLHELGYPVEVLGIVVALAGMATLFSRAPVARLYRPERARTLLLGLLVIGAATYALMPVMPGLIPFVVVLLVNRVVFGMATTVFLARYLDLMVEGTDRRRAMGFYGGTQAIGYTASNLLVGVLADAISLTASFLFGTVSTIIAIALLLLSPSLAPKAKAPATRTGVEKPRGIRGWVHAVADPGLWSVLNGAAWNHVLQVVLVSFFPVYATGIGLSASQIGIARALYSAINSVGRFLSGFVLSRFRLRDITYFGIGLQAVLMAALPFVSSFPLIMAMFFTAAFGRSIVIVSNSAQLAEEVDESRVSRGVATSAFSAAPDVASVGGPLVGGFIAGLGGTGWMFGIIGVGTLSCFALGELAVNRWKNRRGVQNVNATAALTAPQGSDLTA